MDIDWQFNGLPLHVLLVHGVVVLVPLAALAAVLAAAWPAARRRIGVVAPALALTALLLVPITVEAGEWLAARVAATPLLGVHMDLARTLLPWASALFLLSTVQWGWHRFAVPPGGQAAASSDGASTRSTPFRSTPFRSTPFSSAVARHPQTRTVITVVIAVLVILVAVAATLVVVAIGEAGSRAVWLNSF